MPQNFVAIQSIRYGLKNTVLDMNGNGRMLMDEKGQTNGTDGSQMDVGWKSDRS